MNLKDNYIEEYDVCEECFWYRHINSGMYCNHCAHRKRKAEPLEINIHIIKEKARKGK